jgi:hypothetical protein
MSVIVTMLFSVEVLVNTLNYQLELSAVDQICVEHAYTRHNVAWTMQLKAMQTISLSNTKKLCWDEQASCS